MAGGGEKHGTAPNSVAAPYTNVNDLVAESRAEAKRPIPTSKPTNPEDQKRLNQLDSQDAWARRRQESAAHAQTIASKRGSVRRDPTSERVQKYVDGLQDRLPGGEKTATKCKPLAPVFVVLIYAAFYVSKGITIAAKYLHLLWSMCPQTVIKIAYGLALCFFGGTFVVAIAASEAFYAAGWQRAYWSCLLVYDEARRIRYALEEDDYVDADGDGVADVDQIGSKELVSRKVGLAFRTVDDPAELQSAFGNLWGAYLAVLATLQFKFARTTAFAVGIASSSRFFFLKLLGPPLNHVMPAEAEQWCARPRARPARGARRGVAWRAHARAAAPLAPAPAGCPSSSTRLCTWSRSSSRGTCRW